MEPLKKIADIDINNSQTLLCGKCVESYLNASKPWMSNGTIVGISCCQKECVGQQDSLYANSVEVTNYQVKETVKLVNNGKYVQNVWVVLTIFSRALIGMKKI